MKISKKILPLVVGGSMLLPVAGESLTEPIQAEAPVKAKPFAKVARKLGFAAHAPADAEGYLSIIGGYDMYQRVKRTKLGRVLAQWMKDEGMDLDDLDESEEFQQFKAVVGQEIFFLFGDQSGEQGQYLTEAGKISNYFQGRMLIDQLAAVFSGEDVDEMGPEEILSSIFENPEEALKLLENAEMPPVTIGFRVSNLEMREQFAQMIGGMMMMMGGNEDAPVELIQEKKAGVDVSGIRVLGKKLVESIDKEDQKEMEEAVGGKANLQKIFKLLKKKNLNIVTGVKGEYVFIYLGGSLDGLKFAPTAKKSLAGHPEMSVVRRNYGDKDIRFLVFGEDEAMKKLYKNQESVGSLLVGVKEGLAKTKVFGKTRDVQALLGYAAKLEGKLYKMTDWSGGVSVGFLEDGFKLESHGWSNLPALNHEKALDFSVLEKMDDLLFLSNSRINKEFSGTLFEMLDSLGEAGYLMARRISKMDVDDDFKEPFGMFDKVFSKDLAAIWDALSGDWADAVGDEGAFIVDLKGTMPKVPEVPAAIIEKGLAPRVAYVTSIENKEKLTQSWKKIEKAVTSALKSVGEQGGAKIPMQAVDSKLVDGIQFHTTPIPFTTDDARPVIGISEKNFYFGTSQTFVSQIESKLKGGAAGEKRTGSYTKFNLAGLGDYAGSWVKLLDRNATEIFENEFVREEFKKNLPMVKKVIRAFKQFEEVTIYNRLEDGKARGSFHFKVKK